jgi:hypothetical protein
MFNQSRQDQAPFRQAGLVGLNQYMNMLGLGGTQPAYGTPGNGGSAIGAYTGSGAPDLVTTQNGIPAANQQLYQSDPNYARAWDQVAQEHFSTFGKNYQSDSSPSAIAARLGQLYKAPAASSGIGAVGYEHATPVNLGGSSALSPLGGGPNGNSQQDAFAMFRNTPGYQFGLDEGAKAVQASAAARGGLNSGATLKALTKFGNDYADQQGYTPYMNRLAALSGMAQTSTN